MKKRFLYVIFSVFVSPLWSVAFAATGASCDVTTLHGAYGFEGMGWVEQKTQNGARFDPLNEVGKLVYDGKGAVSLSAIVSFHNAKPYPETASGVYSVNSDCTGAVSFNDNTGKLIATLELVIVKDGKEISTLYATPTFAMTFTQRKQ